LRQITLAADAWSRGDFSVKTRASSRDEVGQLARDLNCMADQLRWRWSAASYCAWTNRSHFAALAVA